MLHFFPHYWTLIDQWRFPSQSLSSLPGWCRPVDEAPQALVLPPEKRILPSQELKRVKDLFRLLFELIFLFNPIHYCKTYHGKDIWLWAVKHLPVWGVCSRDTWEPQAFGLHRRRWWSRKAAVLWLGQSAPRPAVPSLREQRAIIECKLNSILTLNLNIIGN